MQSQTLVVMLTVPMKVSPMWHVRTLIYIPSVFIYTHIFTDNSQIQQDAEWSYTLAPINIQPFECHVNTVPPMEEKEPSPYTIVHNFEKLNEQWEEKECAVFQQHMRSRPDRVTASFCAPLPKPILGQPISLGVGKLHGGTLGIMPEPRTVDSLGLQVVGSWPAALNRSVVVGPSRQLSGGEVQLGHSDQAGRFTMDDDVVEDSPFVISEGLPPVPVKLVKKILTLESELV